MTLGELIDSSKFEDAAHLIHQSLSQSGVSAESAHLLEALGVIAYSLGSWDMAEWAYSRLSSLLPGDQKHAFHFAYAAAQNGNLPDAISVHGRWISILDGAGEKNVADKHRYYLARAMLKSDLAAEAEDCLVGVTVDLRARYVLNLLQTHGAGGFRVISALASPLEFEALTKATEWRYPPGWFPADTSTLSMQFHTDRFERENAGFIISNEAGEPLLRADLCLTEEGLFGPIGPIQIIPARKHPHPSLNAQKRAVEELESLRRIAGGRLRIADYPGLYASDLGIILLKKGYRANTRICMEIDLTQSEESLWNAIRPRTRRYIRNGEAELSVEYLNAETKNWALLDVTRALHYVYDQTAREPVFYQIPIWRRLLAEGKGELAVYSQGGTPMGVLLIIDEGGNTGVNFFARYPRHPGSHVAPYALWNAILRSRSRGMTCFHVGMADFEEYCSHKFQKIVQYKAAFTKDFRYDIAWTEPPSDENAFNSP